MSNIIRGIDLPIMCQVQMFLQYQEVPAMTDVGVFRQLPSLQVSWKPISVLRDLKEVLAGVEPWSSQLSCISLLRPM